MFWFLRRPFFFLYYWDRAAPSHTERFWRSKRARMCLFGSHCCHSPFRGSNPPKPPFGGVNRLFQAQRAKYWNLHIMKTTASITTKFCTTLKTTTCSSWVVQIRSKQIQDGGPLPFRKKVKSQYVRKNFDWFWCNLARCRKLFPVGDRLLKLWIFENPRWRRPPSWKSQKSRYHSYGLTDLREIWHADAECVS